MAVTVAELAVSLVVETGKAFGQIDKALSGMATKFARAGRDLSVGLTAPIAAVGGIAIKAATDFESAFAGVVKTVDEAADDTGTLTEKGLELRQMFRDLAKEIPVPVEDLAKIGELAGQLGVPLDQIENFTENIARLAVSTNLSVEEAASQIARFQNIVGASGEPIDALASTIVYLGNELPTTETELLNFAMRIAGAGRVVGLTQDQILAIGGALAGLGVPVEAGGTAISRVLVDMANAVAGTTGEMIDNSAAIEDLTLDIGELEDDVALAEEALQRQKDTLGLHKEMYGEDTVKIAEWEAAVKKSELSLRKKQRRLDEARGSLESLHLSHGTIAEDEGMLEKLAEVAGVTGEEFKQAFEEDAAGAMLMFVKGLGKIEEEGGNIFAVIEDLGWQNVRTRDTLLKLAGGSDLLADSLGWANTAWEEETALMKESEIRFQTVANQIQLAKNQIKDMAITLGDALLPMLTDLLDKAGPIVEKIHAWIQENPELVQQIAMFAAGLAIIGPILLAVGSALSTISAIIGLVFSPIG